MAKKIVNSYKGVMASLLEANSVKSWVIVILSALLVVVVVAMYMISTQPLRVLVIPGAAPGFYTAGNDIPLSAINYNAEQFLLNITNYNKNSFARNINNASNLMTQRCRSQKRKEIAVWKKSLKRFSLRKSFFPSKEPKVFSKSPYILEFTGEFTDLSSAGSVILEGTQVVRLTIIPKSRTTSNLLGYAVDNWEIIRHVRKK